MDLLFAENSKRKTTELNQDAIKDLALQEILDDIAGNESNMIIVRDIMTRLPEDPDDIRYRQEIMKDFMNSESLVDAMEESLESVKTLKDYNSMKTKTFMTQDKGTLYTILENLRELAVFVNVTEDIVRILKSNDVKSTGLKRLLEGLEEAVNDEFFEKAKKDINKMLEDLSCVRGAIVGVNFSPDLNVQEVSAVEFVPYKIRSKYKFAEIAASISNIMNAAASTNSIGQPQVATKVVDPLLVTMTPLIEKHLKKHFVRLNTIMNSYVHLDSNNIIEMYEALIFYISMARFAKRLESIGCDICMPKIRTKKNLSESEFNIKDIYNVRLVFAGEKNIVKNDFTFTPKEKLYILTGPNRGGKTIIEQAIGIVSVFASSGSFVTASSCTGLPFKNILTHFPIDENLTINYGRLGEEAVRIKEIVKETDDRTLILFNETYSTTSAEDGLYLSKDLLKVLKEKGSACIFNTHIHAVARSIEEMNGWKGESDFVSIIMEIKDNVNTFHVKRSEPDSCSYARNIAEKYGITYEQMIEEEDDSE